MSLNLTPASLLQRSTEVIATELDDEIVLMSLAQGHYYGLKTTSRRIWELLETPRSFAELCQCLAQEYQAPPGRIEAEVAVFLQQLAERQLVMTV